MLDSLTGQQIRNLERLAAYLDTLPPDYAHFDMVTFVQVSAGATYHDQVEYARGASTRLLSVCGTVACAVGHGPAAGVPFAPSHIIGHQSDWTGYQLDWTAYSRQFCPVGLVFTFLFGEEWTFLDNTPQGAAARIRYVLAGRPLPSSVWSGAQQVPLNWSDLEDLDEKHYPALRAVYAPYVISAAAHSAVLCRPQSAPVTLSC